MLALLQRQVRDVHRNLFPRSVSCRPRVLIYTAFHSIRIRTKEKIETRDFRCPFVCRKTSSWRDRHNAVLGSENSKPDVGAREERSGAFSLVHASGFLLDGILVLSQTRDRGPHSIPFPISREE